MLVEGKIPALTDCPYRNKCQTSENGLCAQKGAEHPVPFSCGTARAIELYTKHHDRN